MRYLGRNEHVRLTLEQYKDLARGIHEGLSLLDPEQLDQLEGPIASSYPIVVSQALEPHEVIDLVARRGAKQVVQTENSDFSRQIAFASAVSENADEFFKHPEKLLVGQGSQVLLDNPTEHCVFEVNPQTHRDEILEQLRATLERVTPSLRSREMTTTVADEMLMNIMKDAPKYFKEMFPQQSTEGRASRLGITWNNHRLLIYTIDDFGSMKIDKMMARLQECYQEEQITPVDQVGSGAGLGCRIIYENTISMSVLVKPQVKTVFCAVLPLGVSLKKQQATPKNLQVLALSF